MNTQLVYHDNSLHSLRAVSDKFQDFAQKKKLKHAGDPDVNRDTILPFIVTYIFMCMCV